MRGNKKYTYLEVKKYIESLGYELISDEYKNRHTNLIIIDKNGYYFTISLCGLKSENSPSFVHKNNPYTIQNIKLWCKLNNKPFELISDKYENNNKKLKWRCLKDNCGEIFNSNWADILQGYGCGFCVGRQVGLSNCLATKNPKLASEWHPTKNGKLTPYNVTCNSNKNIWWMCVKGHEWNTGIASRNNGIGCPYCAGKLPTKENNLLICNPKLCEEWDYSKNDKNPEEYCPNSHKKVWWKCSKCNHEWKITIKNRNQGDGCPLCSNSKANNKIIDICKINNFDYIPEYRIDECKDKNPLPFDVGIIHNNILYLVEADGKQHYEPVNFGGISDERALENFKITQYHDKIKNQFCKDNNIPLLRIPYWDFKNIETILNKYLITA